MRKLLFLHPSDNIAVALIDFNAGEKLEENGLKFTIVNPIPHGHKIATVNIAKGDGIIKYGERMGHSTKEIKIGEHVHTHNVLGDRLSTEKN